MSTLHAGGLDWVSGHAGVRGNEIADGLARCGSASSFVGSELAMGDPRQDLGNRINCWLVNQH
jgi:ribonuclease HI